MCAKELRIIHVDKDFIVAFKPAGMPSAPLCVEEKDTALYNVSLEFPEVLDVSGFKACEGGLLHRLDTATSGLLLFARTQSFFDSMAEIQRIGEFKKEYTAVCDIVPDCAEQLKGFPPLVTDVNTKTAFGVSSFFRAYGEGQRSVRPVVEPLTKFMRKRNISKKEYYTEIYPCCIENNTLISKCVISSGFRHQVRCHLAWCGMPVVGDILYNPNFLSSKVDSMTNVVMKFFATGIYFPCPSTGKIFCLKLSLDDFH